jgi:hypothetical protein
MFIVLNKELSVIIHSAIIQLIPSKKREYLLTLAVEK